MAKKSQGLTEAQFLSDEDMWPHWPMLPVKDRKDGINKPVGLVITGVHTTVYVGVNLYSPSKDFENAPTKEYPNVEALLNVWTID